MYYDNQCYIHIQTLYIIRRPQSSLANNPVNPEKHENPDLIEKGLNLLLSISDRVEEMKVKVRDKKIIFKILFLFHGKVKSTTNLCTQNETDKRSPLTPRKFKKERSLSVNSYLLSPPPTTPKGSGSSANTSPRNMSLPGNKIFCFPPTFSNDLHPPGSFRKFSINSDGSRPLSRKTSGIH